MTPDDLTALWITLKLAALSALSALVLGALIGWWLARTHSRFRGIFEAVLSLPMVVPPSVLGFYLLVLLGPKSPVAFLFEKTGLGPFSFTFTGLIIGCTVSSLPFVIRPIQVAFSAINDRVLEAAATLGASPINRFFTIALPQARAGLITAAILGFAHAAGAFGVVLMIGGNIPGQTRVLSVAIYNHVEMMEYSQAHMLSGILVVIALVLMSLVHLLNPNKRRRQE